MRKKLKSFSIQIGIVTLLFHIGANACWSDLGLPIRSSYPLLQNKLGRIALTVSLIAWSYYELFSQKVEGYQIPWAHSPLISFTGITCGALSSAKIAKKLILRIESQAQSCIQNLFPNNPHDFTRQIGIEPITSMTQHGTKRFIWEPNSNTKIRFESHPEDLTSEDPHFNPRHHGEHYHVEIKPSQMSWTEAIRRKALKKCKPVRYQIGQGTGFLAGESYPGRQESENESNHP